MKMESKEKELEEALARPAPPVQNNVVAHLRENDHEEGDEERNEYGKEIDQWSFATASLIIYLLIRKDLHAVKVHILAC